MTLLSERHQVIELVSQAITAGARQDRACGAISLNERTLQRWQRDQSRGDGRPARVQAPRNRLSGLEHQALLTVANSAEFGHLSPSQNRSPTGRPRPIHRLGVDLLSRSQS